MYIATIRPVYSFNVIGFQHVQVTCLGLTVCLFVTVLDLTAFPKTERVLVEVVYLDGHWIPAVNVCE